MRMDRIVAVTFCKNEESTISRCVQSVLDQTQPLVCYVVLDDGSTDGTYDLLRRFEEHIVLVKTERVSPKLRGAGMLEVLMEAVEKAYEKCPNWNYLLKVDADSFLSPSYVETLMKKMDEDRRLGLVSGVRYTKVESGYRRVYRPKHHAADSAKLYRRECFDQIRYPPLILGWDTWMQIEAKRLGWKAESFEDAIFFEERPYGGKVKGYTYAMWLQLGFTRAVLGDTLLYHTLNAGIKTTWKPYFVGGLISWLAYIYTRCFLHRPLSRDYYCFVKLLRSQKVIERLQRFWSKFS